MKKILLIVLLIIAPISGETKMPPLTSFYDIKAKTIDGQTIRMEKYSEKKILIVNVASKCGYTSQYKGLQELHKQHSPNLVVLGFPSNDFFWQEPGSNSEIEKFCKLNYGVTFQMFEKIHVKGKNKHPLYEWLSESKLNGWNDVAPSWNFCKYLVDEKGQLIEYYNMKIEPTDTLITRHLKDINIP
jgi:glutathione peroxidase